MSFEILVIAGIQIEYTNMQNAAKTANSSLLRDKKETVPKIKTPPPRPNVIESEILNAPLDSPTSNKVPIPNASAKKPADVIHLVYVTVFPVRELLSVLIDNLLSMLLILFVLLNRQVPANGVAKGVAQR